MGLSGGTLQLWDAEKLAFKTELHGHVYSICHILRMQGGRFASGSNDRTVRIWDVKKLACLAVIKVDGDVASLEHLTDGSVVVGSSSSNVHIADKSTGRVMRVLRGHKKPVTAVCLTPAPPRPGTTYRSGEMFLITCCLAGVVNVWDIESGVQTPFCTVGVGAPVWSAAAAPQGATALGLADGSVLLCDLIDNARMRTFVSPGRLVRPLVVLGDNTLVSCHQGDVVQWDLWTGERQLVYRGHEGRVHALAALADGRVLTGGEDGVIRGFTPPQPPARQQQRPPGTARAAAAAAALGSVPSAPTPRPAKFRSGVLLRLSEELAQRPGLRAADELAEHVSKLATGAGAALAVSGEVAAEGSGGSQAGHASNSASAALAAATAAIAAGRVVMAGGGGGGGDSDSCADDPGALRGDRTEQSRGSGGSEDADQPYPQWHVQPPEYLTHSLGLPVPLQSQQNQHQQQLQMLQLLQTQQYYSPHSYPQRYPGLLTGVGNGSGDVDALASAENPTPAGGLSLFSQHSATSAASPHEGGVSPRSSRRGVGEGPRASIAGLPGRPAPPFPLPLPLPPPPLTRTASGGGSSTASVAGAGGGLAPPLPLSMASDALAGQLGLSSSLGLGQSFSQGIPYPQQYGMPPLSTAGLSALANAGAVPGGFGGVSYGLGYVAGYVGTPEQPAGNAAGGLGGAFRLAGPYPSTSYQAAAGGAGGGAESSGSVASSGPVAVSPASASQTESSRLRWGPQAPGAPYFDFALPASSLQQGSGQAAAGGLAPGIGIGVGPRLDLGLPGLSALAGSGGFGGVPLGRAGFVGTGGQYGALGLGAYSGLAFPGSSLAAPPLLLGGMLPRMSPPDSLDFANGGLPIELLSALPMYPRPEYSYTIANTGIVNAGGLNAGLVTAMPTDIIPPPHELNMSADDGDVDGADAHVDLVDTPDAPHSAGLARKSGQVGGAFQAPASGASPQRVNRRPPIVRSESGPASATYSPQPERGARVQATQAGASAASASTSTSAAAAATSALPAPQSQQGISSMFSVGGAMMRSPLTAGLVPVQQQFSQGDSLPAAAVLPAHPSPPQPYVAYAGAGGPAPLFQPRVGEGGVSPPGLAGVNLGMGVGLPIHSLPPHGYPRLAGVGGPGGLGGVGGMSMVGGPLALGGVGGLVPVPARDPSPLRAFSPQLPPLPAAAASSHPFSGRHPSPPIPPNLDPSLARFTGLNPAVTGTLGPMPDLPPFSGAGGASLQLPPLPRLPAHIPAHVAAGGGGSGLGLMGAGGLVSGAAGSDLPLPNSAAPLQLPMLVQPLPHHPAALAGPPATSTSTSSVAVLPRIFPAPLPASEAGTGGARWSVPSSQ